MHAALPFAGLVPGVDDAGFLLLLLLLLLLLPTLLLLLGAFRFFLCVAFDAFFIVGSCLSAATAPALPPAELTASAPDGAADGVKPLQKVHSRHLQ